MASAFSVRFGTWVIGFNERFESDLLSIIRGAIAFTVVSKVQYDVDGGATDVNSWMCTLQYFVLFFFGLPGCSNII